MIKNIKKCHGQYLECHDHFFKNCHGNFFDVTGTREPKVSRALITSEIVTGTFCCHRKFFQKWYGMLKKCHGKKNNINSMCVKQNTQQAFTIFEQKNRIVTNLARPFDIPQNKTMPSQKQRYCIQNCSKGEKLDLPHMLLQ